MKEQNPQILQEMLGHAAEQLQLTAELQTLEDTLRLSCMLSASQRPGNLPQRQLLGMYHNL